MRYKGFTLIETLVAVAAVGIVTVMALVTYKWSLLKAQSKESAQMIQLNTVNVAPQLKEGRCTVDGKPLTIKGKYGELIISGNYANSGGSSCPSGCTVQYKFNANGVDPALAGKLLSADVLNNSKLSKNDSTTLAEKYWPHDFIKKSPLVGDNCAAIAPTDPTQTKGDATGTETGLTDPTTPAPGGGTTDPTTPGGTTDPTTPGGSTDPSNPDPSNPSGTTDPTGPSLQEQADEVKKFLLSADFIYNPGPGGGVTAGVSIRVPSGYADDYYDVSNYRITTTNGNTFGWSTKNIGWKKGYYNLPGVTNVIKPDTYVKGTECPEGGGCYTVIGYKYTANIYYKGQFARSITAIDTYVTEQGTN